MCWDCQYAWSLVIFVARSFTSRAEWAASTTSTQSAANVLSSHASNAPEGTRYTRRRFCSLRSSRPVYTSAKWASAYGWIRWASASSASWLAGWGVPSIVIAGGDVAVAQPPVTTTDEAPREGESPGSGEEPGRAQAAKTSADPATTAPSASQVNRAMSSWTSAPVRRFHERDVVPLDVQPANLGDRAVQGRSAEVVPHDGRRAGR